VQNIHFSNNAHVGKEMEGTGVETVKPEVELSECQKVLETTLGEKYQGPNYMLNSEEVEVKRLGQRPKMSSNGEPLGAGLHSTYTTIHEGYVRLSMRLRTVQSYTSDVMVELRLCRMTPREATCTA